MYPASQGFDSVSSILVGLTQSAGQLEVAQLKFIFKGQDVTQTINKIYPLPAVAALIANPKKQVLIVRTHKWSGLWGVPGGKIDYGETIETALRREMREEVGLEIYDLQFAFNSEIIEDPKFYKPMHFVSLEFVARCDSDTVVMNEEIAEFAWVSLEEAFTYPVNVYTLRLLEWCKVNNFPGQA
jgi:nucleoside triphosphatase